MNDRIRRGPLGVAGCCFSHRKHIHGAGRGQTCVEMSIKESRPTGTGGKE